MYKELKHISEAVLWDNLKRKANKTLKEIDEKSNDEKIKIFNKKYPKKLQRLLEDIGKELFKIFLFKAIEDSLEESKENDAIEKVIKNFNFYFWPGYTTISNKRVFINGLKREKNRTQRFLTGIGNENLKLKVNRGDYFRSFLTNIDSKVINIFETGGKPFWIYNIPSAIAFNNTLNQYYIKEDKKEFIAGSTHKWKSSQFIIDKNGYKKYIEIPLSTDKSEFRILEVGVKQKNELGGVNNNKVSIVIEPDKLNRSSEIIKDRLNSAFSIELINQWPRVTPTKEIDIGLNELFQLQTKLYTYWISETLDNPKSKKQNYSVIRKELKKYGFEELSKRIIPFKKFKDNYHKKEKLNEIYYKYWNTIFLESFSDTADLGTAMFLTSHQYDSEFWMKCSSAIRQIYNELRIMEAIAQTEAETENRSFSLLRHTQRHYLNAMELSLKRINDNSASKKLIDFNLQLIDSHLDIIEHIEKPEVKSRVKIYDPIPLDELINHHLEMFNQIIKEEETVLLLIKNIKEKDKNKFIEEIVPLVEQTKINRKVLVKAPKIELALIIKELIINALENIDLDNPIFTIRIDQITGFTLLKFTNSISSFIIKNKMDVFKKIYDKEIIKSRLGWRVIFTLLRSMEKWEFYSSSLESIKSKRLFSFTIKIPNYEQT